MIAIADCTLCLQIPQRLEIDYEHGDSRPLALSRLDSIASERKAESAEEWTTWGWLRCPDCWTLYHSSHWKDEGHSFMDPTNDKEWVHRLTPDGTLEWLAAATAPALAPLRTELVARRPRIVDDLALLLLEQKQPNWEIAMYAIESVMDSCLLAGSWERILAVLLHNADPAVRAWATTDLTRLERWSNGSERDYSKALQRAARDLLSQEDRHLVLVGVFLGVLAVPARQIQALPAGTSAGKDSHHLALDGLSSATFANSDYDRDLAAANARYALAELKRMEIDCSTPQRKELVAALKKRGERGG